MPGCYTWSFIKIRLLVIDKKLVKGFNISWLGNLINDQTDPILPNLREVIARMIIWISVNTLLLVLGKNLFKSLNISWPSDLVNNRNDPIWIHLREASARMLYVKCHQYHTVFLKSKTYVIANRQTMDGQLIWHLASIA